MHRRRRQSAQIDAPTAAVIQRSEVDSSRVKSALILLALLAAVLTAYQPAWHGRPLWDDDAHLTRPELQSIEGLRSIWLQPGATQQYYPVAHSAFWTMHRVWGDATTGYHLANIALHAVSAFLLWILLRRLAIPGAALAAVLFALHPVHVESVAWMTELKNTLSGVWYLAAAIVYLRFERTRRSSIYLGALALFVLALLTKSVTATLPAGLLVLAWWMRGTVRWREDVVPLLPFFGLAAIAAAVTSWVERHYVGAQGFEFELSLLERFLVAGRALWFYIGKLAWPTNLTFTYPRWIIDTGAAWQYAFPLAASALLLVLWRMRTLSRAPLAAALLFGGTLFPALGFFDVFPFRYSFVADHFQYLASIAPIALFAAGVILLLKRAGLPERAGTPIAMAALGIPLAVLTWQQSRQYVDAETLYRVTLERNPACWLCHNNLAKLRFDTASDREQALAHIDASLRINPKSAEGHHNRGVLLRLMGRHGEALVEQQEAVHLAPIYPEAHNELGAELQAAGRTDEALIHYGEALRLAPRYAEAHVNAAEALASVGRTDEALDHLRIAVALKPDYATAHHVLGTVTARLGRIDEALAYFDTARRLDPADASVRNDRATALAALGRLDEADAEYREALRLDPADAKFQDNFGYLLLQRNRRAEALPHFAEALRIDPSYAPARVNVANLLLDAGRAAEAIPEYERALQNPVGGIDLAQVHSNLGIACALSGRRADAIAHFTEALRLRPDFEQARANLARALRSAR